MPTLPAQARGLGELAMQYERLHAAVEEQQAFKSRAATIAELRSQFAPAVAAAELLYQAGLPRITAPSARQAMEAVRQLQQTIKDNPEALHTPPVLQSLKLTLEACKRELRRVSEESWRGHCMQRLPQVDDPVLDAFKTVPDLRRDVEALQQGIAAIKQLGNADITTAAIDSLNEHARKVEALWGALDGGHIEPEVLAFVRKAAGTGAALEALTPKVMEWLTRRHVAASFSIRTSR